MIRQKAFPEWEVSNRRISCSSEQKLSFTIQLPKHWNQKCRMLMGTFQNRKIKAANYKSDLIIIIFLIQPVRTEPTSCVHVNDLLSRDARI